MYCASCLLQYLSIHNYRYVRCTHSNDKHKTHYIIFLSEILEYLLKFKALENSLCSKESILYFISNLHDAGLFCIEKIKIRSHLFKEK